MHLLIFITIKKLDGQHVWDEYTYLREDLLCTSKCASKFHHQPPGFPHALGAFVIGEVWNRSGSENC
jgi:hypothetical protein